MLTVDTKTALEKEYLYAEVKEPNSVDTKAIVARANALVSDEPETAAQPLAITGTIHYLRGYTAGAMALLNLALASDPANRLGSLTTQAMSLNFKPEQVVALIKAAFDE